MPHFDLTKWHEETASVILKFSTYRPLAGRCGWKISVAVSESSFLCVFSPDINEVGALNQWPALHLALPVHSLGSREQDVAHQTALLHLGHSCKMTGLLAWL